MQDLTPITSNEHFPERTLMAEIWHKYGQTKSSMNDPAKSELGGEIAFDEAYLFGSVSKPFRFSESSDIDIGFVGLDNRHFFKVMSYLSEETGHDVDIVQIEDHRLADKIKRGGVRWRRQD